jgi:hypothetical protein|tara:strand:- start:1858 stop:2688 length:831 start_codon:yes stop_codon:yes gene_type:complete
MTNGVTRRGATVSLAPQTFSEAISFAKRIAPTNFVPESYRGKPDEILAAMQYGAELGLGPLQSLNSLTVIKGRVGMYAATMRALVDASGLMEKCTTEYDAEDKVAVVTVKRKDRDEATYQWGESDAKLAGLAGRKMYQEYPERMYKARAMSFALRDEFADVLKGLMGSEEMRGDQEFELSDIVDVGEPRALPRNADFVSVSDPELKEKLDKAFDFVHWTSAQRTVKLTEFKGKEEELLKELKQEYRDRNGIDKDAAVGESVLEVKAGDIEWNSDNG